MAELVEPIRRRYRPETDAPTVAAFHRSNAIVRGIRGPVGTGKSVGCCWELFLRGKRQEPWKDRRERHFKGVRRVRSGIVRNTYAELKSTTIDTWLRWFGPWTRMVYDAPIRGELRLELPDGTLYIHELRFVSADRPKDVGKLKSWELTFAWANEASELPKDVIDMLAARIWRYPDPFETGIGATFSSLILDTNAPSADHWYYRLAEQGDRAVEEAIREAMREVGVDLPIYEFFAQPPAILEDRKGGYIFNPACENQKNQRLGPAYWLAQVPGKSKEWIKRYLMGQYTAVASGRVCYPEYDDAIHCAKEDIEGDRELPLLLGWDFWHNPALAIMQISRRGQLRILDELIGTSIGVRNFVRNVAVPFLKSHYNGFAIESWGDPSGNQRDENMESTSLRELESSGIPTRSAWTNEFLARKEAVAGFLTRIVPGEGPALRLNPRCKTLRTGFISGYQVERKAIISTSEEEEQYRDEPVKNMYSHIHEALQYAVLDYDARFERAKREAASVRAGRRRRTPAGPADTTAGY